MKLLFCKKCNKEWMHEMRVWNDMAKSRQVQGMKCAKCGEWQQIKYKPITPLDEQRLRKRKF